MKNNLLGLAVSALLLSSFIAGCGSNPYSEHIATVDSLQTILNQLETTFKNIDEEKHFSARAEMQRGIESIEGYFKTTGDTMPRDIAVKISDFRLAWKGYKRMDQNYKRLEDGINTSKEQLRTLKIDYENGVLSKNLADRFLNEEKTAIAELEIGVNSFDTKMKHSFVKYQEYNPVIIQLTDSLSKLKK
jgi:hypothetical protein